MTAHRRSATRICFARVALLMVVALLAACGHPLTELVVVVDTDLEVPRASDRVEVTITGPSGRSTVAAANLGPGSSLPLSVGAVPEEGAPLTPVTITAIALLQGRTVVERVIRTGFVSGERRVVPVVLLRACAGVACPAGQSCGPQGCASVDVPGSPWPSFSGGVSRLDAISAFDATIDTSSADLAEVFDAFDAAPHDGATDDAPVDAPPLLDAAGEAPVDAGPGDVPDDAVPDDVPAPIDSPMDALDGGAPDAPRPDDAPATMDVPTGDATPAMDGSVADAGADALVIDTSPVDGPTVDARSPDAPSLDAPSPDAPDAPLLDAGCGLTQLCPMSLSCCSGDCVDLQRSIAQCGACGRACSAPANAIARCASGRCDFLCRIGFGDCDGAASTGCETPLDTTTDCGACGRACSLTNAVSACSSSGCALIRCNAGFGDCDGDASNGCEARLDTSSNCGTCGRACDPPAHAASACEAGACVSRCDQGYGDCDGSAANGCETDLRVSSAHCGRCGAACFGGTSCAAGICADEAIVQITAGEQHACAVRRSGTVICWGNNDVGLLGDGTRDLRTSPVLVAMPDGVVEVDAGTYHTCARRTNGQVWCWGLGEFGSLGDGTRTRIQPRPVQVSGLTDAESISSGESFSCARSASRGVVCWGANGEGRLGDGTMTDRTTPVAVSLALGPTALGRPSASLFGHACAMRLGTIEMYCWGQNIYGQLGTGTSTSMGLSVPTQTVTIDAVEVVTGGYHSCARVRSNQMSCWGAADSGQLGNVATRDRYATPQTVLLGTSDVAQMALGTAFSCARRAGGQVSCWGANSDGQLGDGTTTQRGTPRDVVGLNDAVEVTAGSAFACARRATGAVVCWGRNGDGQLNDGTTTNRTRFVYTLGLP